MPAIRSGTTKFVAPLGVEATATIHEAPLFVEYSIMYPAIETPVATDGAVHDNPTDVTPAVATRLVGEPAVACGVAVISTGPATTEPPEKIGVIRNTIKLPLVRPVDVYVREVVLAARTVKFVLVVVHAESALQDSTLYPVIVVPDGTCGASQLSDTCASEGAAVGNSTVSGTTATGVADTCDPGPARTGEPFMGEIWKSYNEPFVKPVTL